MRHALLLLVLIAGGCAIPSARPPQAIVGTWVLEKASSDMRFLGELPAGCPVYVDFRPDFTMAAQSGAVVVEGSYTAQIHGRGHMIAHRYKRHNGERNCQGFGMDFIMWHLDAWPYSYVEVADDRMTMYPSPEKLDQYASFKRDHEGKLRERPMPPKEQVATEIPAPITHSHIECVGSIMGESAAFIIANLEGNDEWRWYQASSGTGTLEYRWAVTPGERTSDGRFRPAALSFGFSLFKWDEPAMSGSLSELFRFGQNDVWTNACRDGVSICTRLAGTRSKAGVYNNFILLGVNDPGTFHLVFGSRPTAAMIEADLPAIGKRHSCVVEIEYENGT